MNTIEHYNKVFASYKNDIDHLHRILKNVEERHRESVEALSKKDMDVNEKQAFKVIWVSSEALIEEIKEAIERMETMMSDFLKVVRSRVGQGYKYPWDVTEEEVREQLATETTNSGKE